MEEEEIEMWYEEEKQKLSEQYIKAIERGMSLDDRERRFTREMENLNKKYEKRHNAFQNGKSRKESTQKMIDISLAPFRMIGKFLCTAGVGFGLMGKGIKSKCAQATFHFNLMWIRNAYKVPDGFKSSTRPLHMFYIKHLKMPLIIISKPFVRFGKMTASLVIGVKEFFANTFALFWKYIKLFAKSTSAKLSAANKNVSAKLGNLAKRYTAWKAKQVQEQIDRRQKKKEAKEKKSGKKEATPQLQTV